MHAQKKRGQALIDSLALELPKQLEDTLKVKILHALAFSYLQIDPDTGMKYGRLELGLAEKLGYKPGIASSYYIIGNTYSIKGNMPEALKNLSASKQIFEEAHNLTGTSSCYSSIGLIYSDQDNYPEALKNLFFALKLDEKIGNRKGVASCYANIGNIYTYQKNYSGALQNFNAALKIFEEAGGKKQVGNTLQDIAITYMSQGNNELALKNALEAIKISEEINDKYGEATCFNVIGSIYNAEKNFPEALKNCQIAIKMLEEMGTDLQLANALGIEGSIFNNQGKYKDALKCFDKELLIAKKVGSLATIRDADESISKAETQLGDYKNAMEAYKGFIAARDSISNEENIKKTVQLQLQYEFDKKEALASAANSKKLQQKNSIIFGALAAFIAFLAIGLLLIRQGKLKARHQLIALEQKQLRAQMNPHFIFNCLNSIQHFVVANDVKNASKYLSGFAALMRQTLENSKESTITLKKELSYLKNYLELEMMRYEDKFDYEIFCADIPDTIEIPPMIIQPFIENAIRHGLCYLKERKGKLYIRFYMSSMGRKGEKQLICEIDDNGIGREQSQKLKLVNETHYESKGMELTRQRLELVSRNTGSEYVIEVKDKKNEHGEPEGTTIIIKFPANI